MIVGYARTSTLDQVAGFEAQIAELAAAGCEKTFQEQVSSVAERQVLAAAMDFVREGDVFVVTKLDRLARSVRDLMRIIDALAAKQVQLRILNMGLDTGSATGRMMLTIVGAFAQFEREMMLERQREGISKAKGDGKYRGRAPTARDQTQAILALRSANVPPASIALKLGISRASVYRYLK